MLYKNLLHSSSLKSNFIWAFWGNAVNGLCQWGILILLAKLGTPKIVGLFMLGMTISAPVMILAHLDLRTLQATDAKNEFLFNHYFGLALLNAIIAVLGIILLTIILGYQGESAIIIFLVALFKAAENISAVFYGLFQQREKMKYVAYSLFIKAPLSLVIIAIALRATESLIISLFCLFIVWIITIFVYDMPVAISTLMREKNKNHNVYSVLNNKIHFLCPVFSKVHLRSMAFLALPLGISLSLGSLIVNIPRYFIERNIGLYELGIYSAISYLIIIGSRFVLILTQSLSPRLALYYERKDYAQFVILFKKQCLLVLIIGLLGILLAIFLGYPILSLLYGSAYAYYTPILVWLMVYASIEYICSIFRNILIIARLLKTELIFKIVSLSSLFIMCGLFIPRRALIGAAFAQLFSTAIYFCCCMVMIFYIINKLRDINDNG